MKKITVLSLSVLAIALSSCKKDMVCECTYTSGSSTQTDTFTIVDVNKATAKRICVSTTDTFTITPQNSTGTSKNECKLK